MLGLPVPAGAPVGQRVDAQQHAVGRRLQPLGHGDVQRDDARLAHRIVEAGPEQVAAIALRRRREPGPPVGRLGPDHAGIPGRPHRDMRGAAIGDPGADLLSGAKGAGQGDDQLSFRIGPCGGLERLAVDRDRLDRQIAVEIDHQPRQRRLCSKVQHRNAVQFPCVRQNLERQVGAVEPHGPLLERANAARHHGLRGQRRLALAG